MPFPIIFAVFLGALWLVPSIATGVPLPFYTIQMGTDLFFLCECQSAPEIIPEEFPASTLLLPIPCQHSQDIWMRDFTTVNPDDPVLWTWVNFS